MADIKVLAEELVNLTVKEVNELATILKEEYGIEPAAAAVAACTPGLCSVTREATAKSSPRATTREEPHSPQLAKACMQQWRPSSAKNK